MFDGSFLNYLSPGLELPLFIIGLALLAFGVGSTPYGLWLAHRARRSKAAATKHGAAAQSFYWATRGVYGMIVGGLLVAAKFTPYGTTPMVVAIVSMLFLLTVMVVLAWRYTVADRNAANARAFDRMIWAYFNGKG